MDQRHIGQYCSNFGSVRDQSTPFLRSRTKAKGTNHCSSHCNNIDIKLLHAVGENLHGVICGDTNLLGILMQDNMLAKFYAETLGIDKYLDAIAQSARQISHRYPHLNVLEIGECTQILESHSILICPRSRWWGYFRASDFCNGIGICIIHIL